MLIFNKLYAPQTAPEGSAVLLQNVGSGQVSCNGNGAVPPASLVEINIAADGGMDFYDVSLVDGFNLPVSVATQG